MQTMRRPCASRQAVSRPRRLVVRASIIQSDAACRVRGHIRNVYDYVSDFSHLREWAPDVTSLTVTRGAGRPLNVRHQYQIEHKLAGMNIKTLYEVVDMQPEKRVVYSAGSELHTGTEQLVFMTDPHDPSFTVVRYISHIELSEWRKALTPVVSGFLKSRPETALRKLSSLLNSSSSPLNVYAASRGRDGTRGASNAWSFNNVLNNLRVEGWQERSSKSVSSFAKTQEPEVDVLGYYAALGLDGRRARYVSNEEIKIAFRRLAQTMHPDKFSTADDDDREQAQQAFLKVQRAYEVLRDPQQRKLYDSGKILEESLY